MPKSANNITIGQKGSEPMNRWAVFREAECIKIEQKSEFRVYNRINNNGTGLIVQIWRKGWFTAGCETRKSSARDRRCVCVCVCVCVRGCGSG
jgi:hypothetical protein